MGRRPQGWVYLGPISCRGHHKDWPLSRWALRFLCFKCPVRPRSSAKTLEPPAWETLMKLLALAWPGPGYWLLLSEPANGRKIFLSSLCLSCL